ncbi:MAG TPA: hypothetical protein VFY50_04685 [Candidatus Nitrosocosmicus sp.]|nr:hypothetical protein [Candidatus Nitrosocosmicus sp.]
MDLKLAYINPTCRKYPPTIKIIAFSGLEKVIIKLTCGGARLLPIITRAAMGIQAYNALLYPFNIKTNSVIKDNSRIIALSIKFGFPNGIAIKPVAIMEPRMIKVV